MRIVMCTSFSGADAGGADVHVAESATALRASGHEVLIIAGSGTDADHLAPGLRPGRVDSETIASVAEATKLSRPDVVHFHTINDDRLGAAVQQHAPLVWSAHGFAGCTSGAYYFRPGQECTRAHGPLCSAHLAFHGCAHRRDPRGLPTNYVNVSRTLRGMRRADTVVAYSSYVFEHLRRNAIGRLVRVPLFVTAPVEVSEPPGPFSVAFIGRVSKHKGLGTLIKALAQTRGDLHIHGDGWWRPRGEQLVARLGLGRRVHFHGWTPRAGVSGAITRASVVAVPSHWPEPFGMVGIEALAASRPVVASATGGTSEWLRDGVNGLLARPGDVEDWARALNELEADPALRTRLGANGRADVVDRYSAARHVADVVRAYELAQAHWESNRARVVPRRQVAPS